MIKKLLIANRGEIVLRIIQACRELGIETVAVYSEADARARHVRFADQSVCIGPAPSAESYLNIPAVVSAARTSGADAVHPGYGFLSQNPAFADACEEAGLVFIGPGSQAIRRMGSKIEARRLMQEAGVPVVPGDTPEDQSDAGLRRSIERVGLPVIVKASAGGGGKGMRRIRDEAEIADAVQAARREAAAAFGDGTLYVERLIEQAHHVEVQVFGSAAGREVVHLFERECSVQRRHQKVIEESPSPSIGADLRDAVTRAGALAARAASYSNAGTVEFLADVSDQSFYFLEMNTRLQVEHPVTEEVLGVDLVRAQLLVASGEALPWAQRALTPRGHAIEARVYAEDPARGFLPQAGRLLLYREPRLPGVRVDSGVGEGDDVPVHYDPLLAKVIASAETRDQAIARLSVALRSFPILGICTNIPFLLRVLDHPRFRSGTADTGFLDAEAVSLAELPEDRELPAHVRAAVDAHLGDPSAATGSPRSWDPWERAGRILGDRAAGRTLASGGPVRIGDGVFLVDTAGCSEVVYVAGSGDRTSAFWNGRVFSAPPARANVVRSVRLQPDGHPTQASATTSGALQVLTAPMPGTVLRILVQPGARVQKGEAVLILEAMKMELPLRALEDASVMAVRCREGELVQADAVLVELE